MTSIAAQRRLETYEAREAARRARERKIAFDRIARERKTALDEAGSLVQAPTRAEMGIAR